MNNRIAAEAAEAIGATLGLKPSQIPGLKLIIKAAIEKAMEQNKESGRLTY